MLHADGALSYDDLRTRACRIAHTLTHDMALIPGNRVLIHAPNSAAALAAWWGVMRAGGVAVGTMPMLRASEIGLILDKARITHALIDRALATEFEPAHAASATLTHARYLDEIDDIAPAALIAFDAAPTAADDPALIAFTSGTTGKPKGCVHFHRDIAAMAHTFSKHVLQPQPDDIFIGTPPFAFTFGLGASVIFPAGAAAATALPDKPGFEALAQAIAKHKTTTLFTSPTGYRALLRTNDAQFSTLHTCVSAGEHLPQATSDQWFARTGIRIIDGTGATEMIHIFVSARGDDIRPGATGKAVPGYSDAA